MHEYVQNNKKQLLIYYTTKCFKAQNNKLKKKTSVKVILNLTGNVLYI